MKAYLAEAIATFALVFVGSGAILMDTGLLGIALAHGIVLMCMVYATGHISGAHINPAVTIGLWITGKIKSAKAVGYIISQLVGAVLAGVVLSSIFSFASADLSLGTPGLSDGISFMSGVIIEAILTFFLVFVVFGCVVDKRAPAGIYGVAIGFVLIFDIIVGGQLTGASMNPARSFGPALISGFWDNHLVYWIGPIIGGMAAAVIYNGLLLEGKSGKRKRSSS